MYQCMCFFLRKLIKLFCWLHWLLDKSTPKKIIYETKYVDDMPTSEVTLVIIRYICPPLHGHTSQYHGHEWMTHILLFHVNRPSHFWDKAISKSKVKVMGWSKVKIIQSALCPINLLPFHFTSIRPTIPEIQLSQNLTLKHPRSRSWIKSKVKVTYYTQYPTNAFPFYFTSIRPTIPRISNFFKEDLLK